MSRYRSRLQIIADVLSIANGGAKKTQIMYKANLSHRLLCRYLKEVLDAGLICEEGDSYVLTAKGKEFLDGHSEYSKHCEFLERQFGRANVTRSWLEKMCTNGEAIRADFDTASRERIRLDNTSSLRGVVLAAGDGNRIKSVTYGAYPKELLPIGNVPTIRFPIEALKLAGVGDIMIVIAAQTKHGIIDGLQSGDKFGVNISYIVQEKHEKCPTGLGQAILSTRGNIQQDDNFIVACGDSILCDFSSSNPLDCLTPLVNAHKSSGAIATVMVYPTRSSPERFGVVKFRSYREERGVFCGELENLVEKPNSEIAKRFCLNGYNYIAVGYYIFRPEIFDYIEKTPPTSRNEVHITDTMALALSKGEKVCAVVHARNEGKNITPCEYWDVGIPEDYREANRFLLDMNIDKLIG